MKLRLALAFALSLLMFAPLLAQPPGPGYVYTIPYGGYPTFGAVAVSTSATAGDVYCVQGSASRDTRIAKIGISATATSAVVGQVSVVLHSSADTGPSTPVTLVPYDSSHGPATATAVVYNSAPTIGTVTGTVRAAKLAIGTTGNTTNIGFILFQFVPAPLLLRGISEFACVNVSALGAGASIIIEHEHAETPQS